ncbi:MAG TPA: FG-GAP-like repeat-containing protein, partial [Bryobacteraceae bacterium]|nr:FG-GAP-like repeat-containing protein [Bryobacteraceae bacterium]
LTPGSDAFRVPAGTAFFSDTNDALFAESQNTNSPFNATTSTTLPGTYSITATFIGTPFTQLFQSSPITREITQLPQSISFSPLSDRPFSDHSSFFLDSSATASSSLPIKFATDTQSVCTVEGSHVTIFAVGRCNIIADQPGDVIYTAAATQTQSFNITAAPQIITFNTIPPKILGSAPFIVSAQSDAHLPVALASTTSSVCRAASTLVTLLATGTCTIEATQAGDANHLSATAQRSFSVVRSSVAGTLTAPAGTPISVGDFTQPFAVAAGDFNEDGVPDLATVGNQSGTVSIALGQVSGGYSGSLTTQYTVGFAPIAIAAADLNGDGHVDLVTANRGDGNLTLLLGQGDGTFSALQQRPATGAAPSSVAVADFNGDSIPDLAVSNSSDNNTALLQGDGTGNFTTTWLAAGANPTAVAVGDFNKDGLQDLAVTNSGSNTVTVFAGQGNGSFTTPGTSLPTGTSPFGVSIVDFDNDGNPDLAVTNLDDSTISLFRGDGTGAFTAAGTPFALNSAAAAVVAGDFNGDGFADLAAPSISNGNVSLLLGDGQGHFALKGAGSGLLGYGLAELDLNGDGFDDLAVTNLAGNTVSILQGGLAVSQSVLSTTSPLSLPANSTVSLTITVTDPNGAFAPPTGTVTFFDGTNVLGTSPNFASPYSFTTPPLGAGPHTITATYGGGSGSDFSVSNPLTFTALQPQTITFNPISDRPMDPHPIQLTATANSGLDVVYTSTTPSICAVNDSLLTLLSVGQCSVNADQPGDSFHDAAATVTQQFNISVASQTIRFGTILNSAIGVPPFEVPAVASSLLPVTVTSLTPSVCGTAATLVTPLSVGTCTLQASQAGNSSYTPSPLIQTSFNVKLAAPSGRLVAQPGIPVSNGTGEIAAGDFNGDQIPDLALANYETSSVSVLLGDGHGGFQPVPGSFSTGLNPNALVAGDFNGDGFSDVITSSDEDGSLSLLFGGSGGALTPAPNGPFFPELYAFSLAVGDFNTDGIEDLAAVDGTNGVLTVFRGDGLGGFTQTFRGTLAGNLAAIAVADFDRNGTQDIAIPDTLDNNVIVMLGDGAGGFTADAAGPFSVGEGPRAISAGDFNADGKSDLAVVNQSGGTLTLLIGDGQGGFNTGASPSTGAVPTSVAVADFTGDGLPDLGVSFLNGAGLTLLLNHGSLSFTEPASSPFSVSLPNQIVSADFNLDGRPDIAAISVGSSAVDILLGDVAPTTSTLTTTSPLAVPAGSAVPFTLAVSNSVPSFNPLSGSATLMEGASLVATAPESTSPFSFTAAGLSAGAHTLTARFTGAAGSGDSISNSITVDLQAAQSISFGPLSDVALGASPIQISATATSGLQVVFTSDTTSICNVAGASVTLVAAGQCSITATQAGDPAWAPASPVTVLFNIAATSPQTITFAPVLPQFLGSSPFPVSAQSTSGLPVTLT